MNPPPSLTNCRTLLPSFVTERLGLFRAAAARMNDDVEFRESAAANFLG